MGVGGSYDFGDVVLQSGATLKGARIAYKTFGALNATKTNAIIYPTSFGAQHSDLEWLIGPGKALDPSRYFIVIPNMFGNGLSSSPSDVRDWQLRREFPRITMHDNVVLQHRLLRSRFDVQKIALVVGFSMGGQQAFHWGALDTFSFAFRKGEGTNDLKTLEGKTILLGSAAWQAIVDPMLAVHGVDIKKINYVEAGWPTWGTALAAGQGDAALSWEGLRAEWIGSKLEFEYWLGVQHSPLFANTFVVRAADLEDPDKKAFLDKYLRAWAMGLEFGYQNPRAAVEAVFEQFPTLATNIGPELGTTSILQQIAVFRGDMDKRKGWGDHDMTAWQTFFDKIHELKQISKPVKAEDVCSNDCVAAANDFDHAKVKADADGYKLSDAFAAIDVENVKAHLYDQAVPG